MGCKYNVDEFKPFISNKIRIYPKPSTDWRLINKGLNRIESIALRSDKLDTTIYDIKFRPFINFLRTENVTMIGDQIQGEFVIGGSRVLRAVADYNETMSIKTGRLDAHIEKKNWKIGHQYESICGETVIYLGQRYTQKFKDPQQAGELTEFTKLKVSYFGSIDHRVQDITTRKLLQDEGSKLSENEAEALLNDFYENDWFYVAFEKIRPVNYTIGLVDSKTEVRYGWLCKSAYSTRLHAKYKPYYFYKKDGENLIAWVGQVEFGHLRQVAISSAGIIPNAMFKPAGEYIPPGGIGHRYHRETIYDHSHAELLQKRLGVVLI